jgi:hypothetical protein
MPFLLLLIAVLTDSQALRPDRPNGRAHVVHGSVTNTNMIGIKDAVVELTNGQFRVTEHAAMDGTFSLSAPPGNYTLSATAKGYCSYTQDVKIAESDAKDPLSLPLLDCSDCRNVIIDFAEPPIEPDVAPPKQVDPRSLVFEYQEENLEDGKSAGTKPTVLFGRRNDLGKFVEYTGLNCPGNEKLAVLRYKGGSLTATRLRLSTEVHKIMGEGFVTVVDRRGVNRGSSVEIDLSSDTPKAVITK